jgi:hypothetical protein
MTMMLRTIEARDEPHWRAALRSYFLTMTSGPPVPAVRS